MGCLAITLRMLAVDVGVAALGPVAAISTLVFRVQELGQIVVVLALVGCTISCIGGGVTLVGGVQDRVTGVQTLGKGGLPSRHGGLTPVEVCLTLIGLPIAVPLALGHVSSQPRIVHRLLDSHAAAREAPTPPC